MRKAYKNKEQIIGKVTMKKNKTGMIHFFASKKTLKY